MRMGFFLFGGSITTVALKDVVITIAYWVNISGIEFHTQNFVGGVRTILAETGLRGHHLKLELTESVLMNNVQSTVSVLKELKQMGIRLAVDDFGAAIPVSATFDSSCRCTED